ncbi:LCP family protein [Priestia koreensis]|uniref:LCP family protein n=1 Tax=Priestia koreensis TaxID=284581 RepID=UPI0034599241
MPEFKRYQKKVNKRKRRKRLFLLFALPILLVGLSATAYGSYLFAKAKSVVNDSFEAVGDRHKSPLRDKQVDPKKDNFSILFMGVDDSDSRKFGNNTRTDALILATFNKKDKSVKMVSIPRDSRVYIPKEDRRTKINHAYVSGGTAGTIDTVENLFHVPVDYYVKINFKAFIEIVTALDGIEFDVPYDMVEKNSHDKHNAIVLKKGKQVLNGEEALAVARTRKKDSDIYRGQRQQEIMKAMISKAANISSIGKYGNLIEAVGNNMKTNLTFGELLSFYDYAAEGSNINIENFTIKGDDDTINGIYYYKLNDESVNEISDTLSKHLEVQASTAEPEQQQN